MPSSALQSTATTTTTSTTTTTNVSSSGLTTTAESLTAVSGAVIETPPRPPRTVRPVDLQRLPEGLRYTWNERDDKEFDRTIQERRRLAAEDDRSLAELRKVRFESGVIEWEVIKWSQQLDTISTQLEEWEKDYKLIS